MIPSRSFQMLKMAAARCRGYLSMKKLSSAGNTYVSVKEDKHIEGLAIVTLQKNPVNTLCPKLIRDLATAIHDIEGDKTKRALIITSAFPGVFSGGLDLSTLFRKTPDEIRQFLRFFQDSWLSLYGSRLVTIAALNGHAVAGGCALAIGCDYRIMAEEDYKIGITISRMGIPPPSWLRAQMGNVIGRREAAKAIQLGILYKSKKALDVGLVDEVVPLDRVLEMARNEVSRWLDVPDHARVAIKHDMRRDLIHDMNAEKDKEIEVAASLIMQPNVQSKIATMLEALKKRKEMKPTR